MKKSPIVDSVWLRKFGKSMKSLYSLFPNADEVEKEMRKMFKKTKDSK